MDKLAQLIQPFSVRSDRGRCIRVAWAFVLLAASCGPDGVKIPSLSPPVVESGPTKPVAEAPLGALEHRGSPTPPPFEWTYAESLEELHAVWLERFSLGAAPEVNPNAIWPYADAVLVDGDSWGTSAESTSLIVVNTEGHAYQRLGAEHPSAGDLRPRRALSPEELAASGWTVAQVSPDVQRFDAGAGFRLAGPVRASSSCLPCHQVAEGRLMALLVYVFQEIPDD